MRILAWFYEQIVGKRQRKPKEEYRNGVIQGWGEHYDD